MKDNIAEINAVHGNHAFLIQLINPGCDVFFVFQLNLVNCQPFVFPALNTVDNALRRIFLVVNSFRFADLLNQTLLVVFVENGKI